MSDIQAWLDQVSARLEAVKKEPAQEDREREATSEAWSDLYEHAPTDLAIALEILDRLPAEARREARLQFHRAVRGRRND